MKIEAIKRQWRIFRNGGFGKASVADDLQVIGVAFLWLFIFCVMGCQGRKKLEPPERPRIETPPPPKTDVLFVAKVEAMPEPNAYHVILGWKPGAKPSSWIVHRWPTGDKLRSTLLDVVDGGAAGYVDASAEAAGKYTYALSSADGSRVTVKGESSVEIPRDLAVTGQTKLADVRGYNRLFLSNDARIYSDGGALSIDVNEIVSDGGSIEPFPEGQKAAPGAAGRAGGTISVHAKKGVGKLLLHARGESGGDGFQGAAGAQGEKGTKGPARVHDGGYQYTYLENGHEKTVSWRWNEREPSVPLGGKKNDWHMSAGGYGGPGGSGLPGKKGGDGGPGGDAARLHVVIDDVSGLDFIPSTFPGKGGRGGNGGPGGSGGEGGDPGDVPDNCAHCRGDDFIFRGERGNAGPKGPDGNAGPDGAARPFCLKLGGKAWGDCSGFVETSK